MARVKLLSPRKVGSSWVLGSEIAVGGDQLTVSAHLSPATVRWASSHLHEGLAWAQRALSRARDAIGSGGRRSDWGRFGPLGELAAGIGAEIARAIPPTDLGQGARLYRGLIGELGPAARNTSLGYLDRIRQDAESGIGAAVEARDALVALAVADELVQSADPYAAASEVSRQARQGDPNARLVALALKALGHGGNLAIAVDVERALYRHPSRDIVGYAYDVFALSGLARRRKLTPAEVQRVFQVVLVQEGLIPPSILPADDRLGGLFWDQYEAFSGLAKDPYTRPMPHYGSGDTDEIWGNREGAGGYSYDPDDYAMRGREWGYGY